MAEAAVPEVPGHDQSGTGPAPPRIDGVRPAHAQQSEEPPPQAGELLALRGVQLGDDRVQQVAELGARVADGHVVGALRVGLAVARQDVGNIQVRALIHVLDQRIVVLQQVM